MKNQKDDTWPPFIKGQPSGDNPSNTRQNNSYLLKSGFLLGLALNALAVLMPASFVNAPKGSAIDVNPLFWPLMLTLLAGLFVGTPLAIIHIVNSIRRRQGGVMVAVGIVALVLNLDVAWVNTKVFSYITQSRSLHSTENCCSN